MCRVPLLRIQIRNAKAKLLVEAAEESPFVHPGILGVGNRGLARECHAGHGQNVAAHDIGEHKNVLAPVRR